MAFGASTGDAFQVRVVGQIEGQQTNNVLHFTCLTGTADVELNLILALAECFVTHLLPVMPPSMSLQRIMWKRVYPTLSNEFVTVPSGFGAGGGASEALPSFVSSVVSIRTLVGGKSHRGRMYVPGIPEDATNGSTLDTGDAYWTALVAFCACVVSKFSIGDPPGGDSFQLCVYSRKIGGSTFPYGAAGFTPVSSFLAMQALGTTRSRKVGRGS